MTEYKITAVCQVCGGDGLIPDQNSADRPQPEIPCSTCKGTGEILSGLKLNDLWDKILVINGKMPNATKIIFTYQIVEVINATEYAALVDAAKDGLRIHLSCGVLDLDHSGQIYANLMAIFGSSPITKAAIEAL